MELESGAVGVAYEYSGAPLLSKLADGTHEPCGGRAAELYEGG